MEKVSTIKPNKQGQTLRAFSIDFWIKDHDQGERHIRWIRYAHDVYEATRSAKAAIIREYDGFTVILGSPLVNHWDA